MKKMVFVLIDEDNEILGVSLDKEKLKRRGFEILAHKEEGIKALYDEQQDSIDRFKDGLYFGSAYFHVTELI